MSDEAPDKIQQVVQQVKYTTIKLHPRELEVLTAASARRLLYNIYRTRQPFNVVDRFLSAANELVNEQVFIAYLAGMKAAGREVNRPSISPGPLDFESIEQLRRKDRGSVDKLIRDMVNEGQVTGKLHIDPYLRRSNMLVQMGIWTGFNRGKLSVFRQRHQAVMRLAQAANYKYKDYYMLQTAADGVVCVRCAGYAGAMARDPDLLPQPPFHGWCRCEIVAIPTVAVLDEQLQFKEDYQADPMAASAT